MATAVTTQKIASNWSLRAYDHDPGTTAATIVSSNGGTATHYLPLANYELIGVHCTNSLSASASGPTLVEIIAASDVSGTDATAVKTSGTIASTVVGDNVFVECTAAQVQEQGVTSGKVFTHFTGRITCSNAGDECVVMLLRGNSKFPAGSITTNDAVYNTNTTQT